MKINGINYRTIWMEDKSIFTIDQSLLPHKFEIIKINSVIQAADAIRNMQIRGAPAIGAMAAFGLALSVLNFAGKFDELSDHIISDSEIIKSTRPTANDLFHAVEKIKAKINSASNLKEAQKLAVSSAQEYADDSIDACKNIGIQGEKLIKDKSDILTHCNAGALATVDLGTALAPIRLAHYKDKRIHVYVDETRPRCQGSRLTAFELMHEKIPHTIIADNAAGYFMQLGKIDIVIVGADRVAANGDVANKIGTYEKAVLAKENEIPFYVAAPISTIDLDCKSGENINIEERDAEEVSHMFGWNYDQFSKIRISPLNSKVKNPTFDITPAKFITGIITNKGIFKTGDIVNLSI